jgi:hypothetical protein
MLNVNDASTHHIAEPLAGVSMVPCSGRRGPLPTEGRLREVLTRPGRLTAAEADAFLSGGYSAYFVLKMRQRRQAREGKADG